MQRICIVTGASQGIGKATAALFLEEGWLVINLSRKSCPIEGVISFNVDFSLTENVYAIENRLTPYLEKAAQICLIHNASWYGHDSIVEQLPEILRLGWEINIVAPSILNKWLIPFMKPNSSILYLGSTLSEKAVAGCASYVTLKHAIVGMMRATCQDLAEKGIHTACICPGFTETEMLCKHLSNQPELINLLKSRVGANRLIAPEEIAKLLHFAALNSVINGAVLHAHLGQLEQ